MTKINQFVDFLCGEAEFPFFKTLTKVPTPKIYKPRIYTDGFDQADFERKENAQDNLTAEEQDSLEIQNEETLEQAHQEKLESKAWEDTEEIDPECDPDSPGINMIGDPKE